MIASLASTLGRRAVVYAALATLGLWGLGCGQQQAIAERERSETLGAGTDLVATLQNTIDTGKNHVGDNVTLQTVEDVRVNEVTVVPAGSTIKSTESVTAGVLPLALPLSLADETPPVSVRSDAARVMTIKHLLDAMMTPSICGRCTPAPGREDSVGRDECE